MLCKLCTGFGSKLRTCRVCKTNLCKSCIDCRSCILCKFSSTNRKLDCLKELCNELNLPFKPRHFYIYNLLNKLTQCQRSIFLTILESFYFCKFRCTNGPLSQTRKCINNHEKIILKQKNICYNVYRLKNDYYRIINGKALLWYVKVSKK